MANKELSFKDILDADKKRNQEIAEEHAYSLGAISKHEAECIAAEKIKCQKRIDNCRENGSLDEYVNNAAE